MTILTKTSDYFGVKKNSRYFGEKFSWWFGNKESALQLPPIQQIQVLSLGREDPLEKKMTTQLQSFLVWEIPWTGEPGGLQSMESQSQTRRSTHAGGWVCLLLNQTGLEPMPQGLWLQQANVRSWWVSPVHNHCRGPSAQSLADFIPLKGWHRPDLLRCDVRNLKAWYSRDLKQILVAAFVNYKL